VLGKPAVTTRILGISAFFHDSAAGLVEDGRVVAAAQEERFRRRKHDPAFPRRARSSTASPRQASGSSIWTPLVKFDRIVETYLAFAPSGFQTFRTTQPLWLTRRLHVTGLIRSELGAAFRGELHLADHHESHAASAFYPSPFAEAAILTLDAVGEWTTSSIGVGRRNRVQLTHELRFPHSLGILYSAFT
jgi:carbamoyltransferase